MRRWRATSRVDASNLGGGGGCIRAVALGDEVDPPEIEVVTRVEGEASAERVEGPSGDAAETFEAGEAEVEGDLARLPLSYRPRAGLQPIQALVARFFSPYRC